MTTGERLQKTMKDKGVTQRELAEAIGVKHAAVSSWQSGRTKIGAGQISQVAKYLDVSPEWLLGIADDPAAPYGDFAVQSDRDITERITKLMKQGKVSQQALADALGIRRATVSYWQTGRTAPRAEQIKSIADALGVSVEYLIKGETKMNKNPNEQNFFVNSLENLNAPTAKQFNQNTFHSENDNRVEFHDNKITADAAENNGDEKEKRPCRDKILELIRKMCDEKNTKFEHIIECLGEDEKASEAMLSCGCVPCGALWLDIAKSIDPKYSTYKLCLDRGANFQPADILEVYPNLIDAAIRENDLFIINARDARILQTIYLGNVHL